MSWLASFGVAFLTGAMGLLLAGVVAGACIALDALQPTGAR